MKNLIIISAIVSLILSACKTPKFATNNNDDDVYANPAEDKRLAKLAAEQKAKKDAEDRQKTDEQLLIQKTKDDSNPLYKDPSYSQDDYYDYKYASRLRRFNTPIGGAGYYDNYYTNQYYYNQNPYNYGTSIYSSYGYMPSNQFYNYSSGLSMSFGSGFGYPNYYNNPYSYNYYPYYGNSFYGYSPYGYNNYGYNGYGNQGYGFNNGYYANNFNNGGWGYYNAFDPNSNYATVQYGPRESNGGGNGGRSTSAGMAVPEDLENRSSKQFFQTVIQQQEITPRFTESVRQTRTQNEQFRNNANSDVTTSDQINKSPRSTNSQNENSTTSSPTNNSTSASPQRRGFWSGFFNNTSTTDAKTNNSDSSPKRSGTRRINESEINTNTNSNERTSSPNPNNGSSSPRNSGGGGGGNGRPR